MKIFRIFLILLSFGVGFTAYASQQDEVAVLTYLRLKPGTETAFMIALDRIVKSSIAEPGNVAWYVQQSVNDPGNIVFYTRWKNEEALQAHLKSPPLVEYIAETAPFLEPGYPKLIQYHPIDQIRDNYN